MFLEKSGESSESPLELEISENDETYARPLSQILTDLRRPIPGHIVHTRQTAGRRVKFLTVQDTIAILDQYAPGWEGTITNIYSTRDRLYIAYRITIHAKRGASFREKQRAAAPWKPIHRATPAQSLNPPPSETPQAKFGLALYL